MPAAAVNEASTFVRRTSLGANEYHTNFRKVDCETILRITSDEAGRVTSQMCKVYLSLLNAPTEFWEREGVLRFAGGEKDGEWMTAWQQLVSLVGVASATARKALQWMHGQGIVGYFAGKNGVGIRIFMNRAASSIGRRSEHGQKNLRLVRASSEASRASAGVTPFRDSYADSEVLEKDLNPRAPKSGADNNEVVKSPSSPQRPIPTMPRPGSTQAARGTTSLTSADEFTELLLGRLEPAVRTAAAQAAAREHERTREWLESKGLPKAARVAQREAYNVLRKFGLITEGKGSPAAQACAGRSELEPVRPRLLSDTEVEELAQVCVAMLEVKGQSVELTISEMSVTAGGFLMPEDAPRVRESAAALLHGAGREET